jgi:multiple sugar transport system permease protein
MDTAPMPVGGVSRRDSQRSHRRHQTLAGVLFILPALLLFALLLVGPLLYALVLSLYSQRLVGDTIFTGLDNYLAALQDPEFGEGLLRMLLFLIVQVPIMLGLALVFALLLDGGRLRLARLIRLGVFIPYAVPSVVAALMWGFLYGRQFGLLGQLGRALGLPLPNFLGGDLILFSIGNVVTWTYTGYNMVILYSALQTVPGEIYEAAATDGAGPIRLALKIKVPLLRPALLLCTVFSVIGSFQLFNEPAILRAAAPDAINSSYTPNLYIYRLAFQDQRLNYAAALSFLLGFVVFALSYVVTWAARRRRT